MLYLPPETELGQNQVCVQLATQSDDPVRRLLLALKDGEKSGALRSEIEAFVDEKHGGHYLNMKKIKTDLAQTNKELKLLIIQIESLEMKKAALLSSLSE